VVAAAVVVILITKTFQISSKLVHKWCFAINSATRMLQLQNFTRSQLLSIQYSADIRNRTKQLVATTLIYRVGKKLHTVFIQ